MMASYFMGQSSGALRSKTLHRIEERKPESRENLRLPARALRNPCPDSPSSQVSSPKHWYPSSVDLWKFRWVLCQVGRPGVRGRVSARHLRLEDGNGSKSWKIRDRRRA